MTDTTTEAEVDEVCMRLLGWKQAEASDVDEFWYLDEALEETEPLPTHFTFSELTEFYWRMVAVGGPMPDGRSWGSFVDCMAGPWWEFHDSRQEAVEYVMRLNKELEACGDDVNAQKMILVEEGNKNREARQ